MNELNHASGKGDKERSPGWRAHYDEIDFHRDQPDGFAHRGTRMVKAYGGRVAKFCFPEPVPASEGMEQFSESAMKILAKHEAGGVCCAKSPGAQPDFLCTRERGHCGPHKAEGGDGYVYETWPQQLSPGQQLSNYMMEKGMKL